MNHHTLEIAIEIAQNVGEQLMMYFGKNPPITRGTPKEVKSYFDELADEHIKKNIERSFPEHSYLTEETGFVDKGSEELWIIDPIDGTGNYVNSNPFFAISIALWKNGKPEVCVIEAPALQERYLAVVGQGAIMIKTKHPEQQPALVSSTRDLDQSYLVFCEGGLKNKSEGLPMINQLYPLVKDMRKLGSAALELAWVGLGRADAYLTQAISIWDIAAGVLFVTEAGGKITHFDGNPYLWSEMSGSKELDIIASNKLLELSM